MSQPITTDTVLSKTQELLQHLQLEAEVTVSYDEQTGYYTIQLNTETPGLLIGYRGESLAAFQLLLGVMINHGSDSDWKKIIVNVGDYRERREATLVQLAKNAAQRVAFSGEPYVFDHLTPGERRTVHLILQDHPQVTTYSEGDGRHRQLVVAPK